MIDYKKALNMAQYEVVTEGDGPCLVLAGAGSGKTRTLVYRVAYLLEKGVRPENILLVTFTNKAAREMLDRVKGLLGVEPTDLNGGTFHHIGNKILRKYADRLGFTRSFSILDQDDSLAIVKEVMQGMSIGGKNETFPKPKVVHSIISFANNTNKSVFEVAQDQYGYPEFVANRMDAIATSYREKKISANAMDFDDLLIKWLQLLQQFPEVRDYLAKQYHYILVDEYQDTNYIQAAVIRELASYHNNILVVGDDAQSIYSFRAADVLNILDFKKVFPTAKTYRIETNYRSTPQILSLANDSISNNKSQFDKALKPVRDDGMMPVLIPARDVYQQAKLVVKKIKERYVKGVNYSSQAVLFRATFHSAELQLELARNNIPYVVRGGMRYFEQAHIKDVVAYVKVLANSRDEIAWKRILRMQEGIGLKTADTMWQQIAQFDTLEDLVKGMISVRSSRGKTSWRKIQDLFKHLVYAQKTQQGFLAHAVTTILEKVYEAYVRSNFDNYQERLEDLTQFVDFVATYDDIAQLLEDVMLSESFMTDSSQEADAIILSTIHQAKGLEWSCVTLLSVRDGDFPHHKSFDDMKQLEEERRLFYVAVTRAKDELTLLYPVRKFSYQFGETNAGPSLFIKELDESRYVQVKGQGMDDSFDNHQDDFYEDDVVYYD